MGPLFVVNRRDFLGVTAATTVGLVLGCGRGRLEGAQASPKATSSGRVHTFVQISPLGDVRIWVSKSDMGQGVRTALPMIVAEELDVDWVRVSIAQADLDPAFGRQGTGGSSSVRTLFAPLRSAGAAARLMLVAAAATAWQVDPAECRTERGFVIHSSGKRLSYGELAEKAATLPVPEKPTLKNPKQYRIIGTRVDRLDNQAMVTGKAGYGIDVRLPGQLFAAVARPPAFGARVRKVDATAARALPGIREVFTMEPSDPPNPCWGGVCVVADSTYAAFRGRDALKVEWDPGPNEYENDATVSGALIAAASRPSTPMRKTGDAEVALGRAVQKVEAWYELPYLAHATMEPMNATAQVKGDSCEIWAPTQFPDWAARAAGQVTGIAPGKVTVHVTLLGGGFGRRAFPDVVMEAALCSKKMGAPVKVTFSREDDMRHDYYRPATHHRMVAGIDAAGKLTAWRHRIASTSIAGFMNPQDEHKERGEVGGADDIPFAIPNVLVECAAVPSGVPRGWWRSVESSFNAFAVCSFLDEIAAAQGKDPIKLELQLLGVDRKITDPESPEYPFDTGRLRRVIELVAQKSGWGGALPKGWGRGFAAHRAFFSYAAEVAEVEVAPGGRVKVHRVVCAIDCGTVVNADGVEAQMEGGILYGLTAALLGKISIRGGGVVEGNFDRYPLLSLSDAPKIEVHLVQSAEAPTGSGEPGLPPIAPAVANAIFAATGKRVRRLPVRKQELA
jgi:isoquinoline 1-oxidoreductase beta subunit